MSPLLALKYSVEVAHYLYLPKDRSSFYFSLFCLFMGVREAVTVWQRVEDAISKFNKTSNKPYRISLSYGFAEFTPGEELNAEDLVETADSQMYRVKRSN